MVKVSVVIPCYNQEEFLEEAINSTLGEYKDFEIIVINDGSNHPDKINEICENFKGIKVKLIHQENQGVCSARNNAILQASGKYILPLDADDMICNEYLELASKILDKNADIGIVYSEAQLFGTINKKWNLKQANIINMLIQNQIFNCAMFRKKDWLQVGGYNNIMQEGCEDWDFWLSLMKNGLKPFKINKILFFYRQHTNTRTHNAMQLKKYVTIRKKIIANHKNLYLKYNIIVLLPIFMKVMKEFLCKR